MILCFVGPVSSPLARMDLAELDARWGDLDRAGLRIYAVSPSAAAEARDLVPRLRLRVPLVLDPEGVVAGAWGVERGAFAAFVEDLSAPTLRRSLRALRLGMPRLAGPHGLTPVAFLLGTDGRIEGRQRARGPLGGLDLDALVVAAGLAV